MTTCTRWAIRRRWLALATGEHASGDVVAVVQEEFGISQAAVLRRIEREVMLAYFAGYFTGRMNSGDRQGTSGAGTPNRGARPRRALNTASPD